MADLKIKNVAVIGAGISGVVTAAHLIREGIEKVTVFERGVDAGGVWRYEPSKSLEPSYPSGGPSRGDYEFPDDPELSPEERRVRHAPPGPAYVTLKTNVPTPMMTTTLLDFPEGSPDYVSHKVMADYIQKLSRTTGVHEHTRYNTRVDELRKQGDYWLIRSSTFRELDDGGSNIESEESLFDAVVVASGHYNAARTPDIPGLKELKQRWPDQVQHSKTYREPSSFKGQNVLLVGAGVSSLDVAKDITPIAGQVFQSSRGGPFDLPGEWLPNGAKRIGEIEYFELKDLIEDSDKSSNSVDDASDEENLASNSTLPVRVVLKDGSSIENIHRVVFGTGYDISYPFFRPVEQYHADATPDHGADDKVLVTADGVMVHNLHDDIFYIPDPTLSFAGTPYHVATFSFFEFQGIAIAKVYAGLASLPSQKAMRVAYSTRVAAKGYGRKFHSLQEDMGAAYVTNLVSWINEEAKQRGSDVVVAGHSAAWLAGFERRKVLIEERYGKLAR